MNFQYDEHGVPVTWRERVTDILLCLAIIALVVLSTTGCTTLPSSEQLKASNATRDVTVSCTVVTGIWGTARLVQLSLDKGAIAGGVVSASPDCQVSGTVEQRAVAVPVPASGARQ